MERLSDTISSLMYRLFIPKLPCLNGENMEKYHQKFGYFKDMDDLAARSKLWITYRHFVSSMAKPSLGSMIDVGGLTINTSVSTLQKDLEEFVSKADKGVILVSFGSMFSSFPDVIVQKLSVALDRLQSAGYRIVWRFKNDQRLNLSPNIWTSNWLPQKDLLAHPKVLLFITHGGYSGQIEAIYHAKPMIGLPIFYDQPYNIRLMIQHREYGIAMDIHEFTSDELVKNALEVITNPMFKKHIACASEIFKSDPQSPAEKAAWWIEHVIKHGGDHLRSVGNELLWYEYWMLDTLLALLAAAAFLPISFIWICQYAVRKIFSNKGKNEQRNGKLKKK